MSYHFSNFKANMFLLFTPISTKCVVLTSFVINFIFGYLKAIFFIVLSLQWSKCSQRCEIKIAFIFFKYGFILLYGIPQSSTMISSSHSNSVIFLPISLRPPRNEILIDGFGF